LPVHKGGWTLYGHALGVLMLETRFPRPPGDIGNATTWPFPVLYRVVRGAHTFRVVGDPDPALLQPFVEAAQELAREGVRAVTTSCGFLSVFQRELAAAVSVPVISSSLLQVPLAAQMIGPDRRVAVLTCRDELTERHFTGAGWSPRDLPVVVAALPPDGLFANVYSVKQPEEDEPEVDTDALERELLDRVAKLLAESPEVGAIVLECTNFVPYSQAIRRATALPVFDLYTMVMQTYAATVGRDFG
jgi:Asp/Glu/hydantoin racemase